MPSIFKDGEEIQILFPITELGEKQIKEQLDNKDEIIKQRMERRKRLSSKDLV